MVWELTLRCDQPCTHCGSRAGNARESELSLEEARAVIRDLRALGAEEVALIGGEAYLHPSFLEVLVALRDAGLRATMVTGGRTLGRELAQEIAARGVHSVSVSVDGLRATHDLMRASRGSFDAAMSALGHLREAGVAITANTNVNRLNQGELEALYALLAAAGIGAWQVQLTTPLGRAADRADLVLQPYELLDVVPRVAALKRRAYDDGILLMPGNNLGYFGPEETLLRSRSPEGKDHYQGCLAGSFLMGIESDGSVKGCPSLQSDAYVGGNLRDTPLAALWNENRKVGFSRTLDVDGLWGFCAECTFRETCLGGCTFTAHAVSGRPGNNPYCHYRARTLASRGRRERIVQREAAPGVPFDHALWDIVEEPVDSPSEPVLPPQRLVQIRRARSRD